MVGLLLQVLTVMLGVTQTSASYQGPCTVLEPIYLLQYIAPNRYRLPAGMEVVYDEHHSVHAFHFTRRATTLNFPASSLLTYCGYFPEEFSFLVTLRVSKLTAGQEEVILALIPPGSTHIKLGVRLYRGKLCVDYVDKQTGKKRVIVFRKMRIFDQNWHTLIITVAGERVSLKIDCGKRRSKKLRRTFPALLEAQGDNLHIANSNRGKRGRFTGFLKQLILLPGSDISRQTCPSSTPHIPDISRQWPGIDNTIPQVPASPLDHDSICTWKDTGKTWFDIYKKTLKVCYSGIWQPVLLPPDQRAEKKMDYLVWHQDIVTAAPTIDIEIFRIPDEGLFMATASFDSKDLKKQQSAIFKWQKGRFQLYQSLYTLGAQAWEHFQIGKDFFLAVANHGERRDKPSKSVIYRWNKKRKLFRVHDEIVTWTARDLEYLQINGDHYLIVANHVKGQNHTINSVLYRWKESQLTFEPVQNITTVGAYDWTHFAVDGYHFLAVANSFSGPPSYNTRLDSIIYFWQDGRFLPFQNIETTGATDWEFFKVHDEYFLAVANAFNFGPHTNNQTEKHMTNSTVYRLNTLRKQFEKYQDIVTFSAVDWEAFEIGDDHYIIISNAQQDGSTEYDLPRSRTRSVIYRWQGVEKFVPVHYLNTLPSADWEVFTVNGQVFLAYANADDNISQIFQVKFV